MAVDLGQHAVGRAQIARPGWRQSGAVGVGFDHHRLANLSRLDPLGCGYEFRIEPTHKSQLEDDTVLLGDVYDLIAFLQVQRHGLFEEYVFLVFRCQST